MKKLSMALGILWVLASLPLIYGAVTTEFCCIDPNANKFMVLLSNSYMALVPSLGAALCLLLGTNCRGAGAVSLTNALLTITVMLTTLFVGTVHGTAVGKWLLWSGIGNIEASFVAMVQFFVSIFVFAISSEIVQSKLRKRRA
jgi:hypothetical protein